MSFRKKYIFLIFKNFCKVSYPSLKKINLSRNEISLMDEIQSLKKESDDVQTERDNLMKQFESKNNELDKEVKFFF